jgi:hypothetical protein
VRLEQAMTLEPEEGVGEVAIAAAEDLGHGDLGIVVADAAWNSTEEGEGADMTFEERLGTFAWEGGHEDRVGVGQGHDEQSDLHGLPVEGNLSFAEVDLGLARRRVGQGDEDLDVTALPGRDGHLDDGQLALVTVLVAESLEDSLGGVPMLLRCLAIVLKDLLNDAQEGFELGLGPRCRAAVARRLGMPENFLERVPMNRKRTANGALALAVDEDSAADLSPFLHVREHPSASKHGFLG